MLVERELKPFSGWWMSLLLLMLAVLLALLSLAIAVWVTVSIRRAYARLKRSGANLIEARK